MLLENSLLLLLAVVLTLISLGFSAIIAMEVYQIMRVVFAGRPKSQQVPQAAPQRKGGDTGPLKERTKQAILQDRETVERMIDHFATEDEE